MSDGHETIALIGAGAMGSALAHGAHAAGRRVTAIASRHPGRAQTLADAIGAELCNCPDDAAEKADVVLLCVPDDAIANIVATLRNVNGSIVAHTAGAKGLAALELAVGRGAHAGSIHPVMVIAAGGRGHEALRGATAAIDGDDVACKWLTAFAQDLALSPVSIPEAHRALYHLSASLVGGLMTGLLASSVDLWTHIGLDREVAATALGRMVQEAGRNLEGLGVPDAVMGPIVRGDVGTIEEHLRVLAIDAPHLVPLYRNLAVLCLPYACERGVLNADQAELITSTLSHQTDA
jgi:predicted short-subunit dehydrogenase-like oxidoreductase (DUF2520 family)